MTDTFQTWLRKCDTVVSGKVGLGLNDLPDANWRDYFDDGLSPKDAADCAYDDQWCDEMPSDLWYTHNYPKVDTSFSFPPKNGGS